MSSKIRIPSSPAKTAPIETARARVVEDTLHSGEMEGLFVSPDAREDAAEYVAGRIDSDELVARTRVRHGLG